MLHPIIVEELELLERVAAVLREAPTSGTPSEAAIVAELARLREMMREDHRVEDQAALLEQWHRQSALLEQLRTSRRAPQVDPNCPYFAHLRLSEAGTERDILLGKATRLQHGVRIVDWRNAPISRIFYRYLQGEEYEEEIAGRLMSGQVVARRTVTIRDQQLHRVDAPEGVFARDAGTPTGWREAPPSAVRLAGGEGSAIRAHTTQSGGGRRLGTDLEGVRRRADKHLPDIAGLLDPQQFALITRPSTGFLVIRGTAGSGKTTVALHRIAYLAFDDGSIDSGRTIVVVFSAGLRDYVSHVLPALGITHVHVRTFEEWATEQVRRLFPMLPREVREDTPALVHRMKLHPAMLVALDRQVQRVAGPRTAAQVIDDWASTLSQAALLEEVFGHLAPEAFTTDELIRAATWSRERYDELSAWLEGDHSIQAELDTEDAALLLRAWQLRIGPLEARPGQPLRYRHIAIDEVQDFSPLEVRVLLGCLDERQSITLAGDTQQHIVKDAGFTSWATFFKDLGLEGTEVTTLDVNYRCTREIAMFATGVLGALREDDQPVLTTRSGPAVEYFRFTDHGACVAFLADALKELCAHEPLASVVILTPSRDLSTVYHNGLQASEVPRLRRVERQNFTFAPGVEVTEVDQVKGLEFDYVILVETSSTHFPDTPTARRLLHVGATRAVHQLWLTSIGTPSPLVREQLPG